MINRMYNTIEPFVFESNCHQRFENGRPVMGLQECSRTISVMKNTNGCKGYILESGKGYIVKIDNNDSNKPTMSEKPMIVVNRTETTVELRGYQIQAQTLFGWMDVDNSDYGLIVHYENRTISKCVLYLYDRDVFIEYRLHDNTPLKSVKGCSSTECEEYAMLAMEAAANGNTSKAHQYGMKVYNSIVENSQQLDRICNIKDIALSLGKLMEGDYFEDNDDIKQAVGLSYYFLSKTIHEGIQDPYLYVYRFSIVWEYNKVFYYLFAHSEGEEYSPFGIGIMRNIATMTYNHHMQGMQMADMLTEPRIARLDPALGNIFRDIYSNYSTTPKEQIIDIGNEYHNQIFKYLEKKINDKDFDF